MHLAGLRDFAVWRVPRGLLRRRATPKRGAPKQTKELTFELSIFECPTFRQLTPIESRLLLEMIIRAKRVSGINGRMAFSARDAAERCNISKNSAHAAFDGLIAAGFIVQTSPGKKHSKERIAATWRLTMIPCDGLPPTRDYLEPLRERKFAAIRELKGSGILFFTDSMSLPPPANREAA
jgi:hypothetical protein